jgi:hypothetical protein
MISWEVNKVALWLMISWEVNKVAHNLARFCFNSGRIISWDGDPPSSVLRDVMNDVSLLNYE